jgi:hypothetical protein
MIKRFLYESRAMAGTTAGTARSTATAGIAGCSTWWVMTA